jgi:hypothetical protein
VDADFDPLFSATDILAPEINSAYFPGAPEVCSTTGHTGKAWDFPITPFIGLVLVGAHDLPIGINQNLGLR